MALSPKLEFRQSQNLVMTPQLQQAIKLLQLSNLDLSAFVEEELERNPLLERDEQPPDRRDGEDAAAEQREARDKESAEASRGDDPEPVAGADTAINGETPGGEAAEAAFDSDYDNNFTNDSAIDSPGEGSGDGSGDGSGGGSGEASGEDGASYEPWTNVRNTGTGFDGGDSSLEQTISNKITLKDHLLDQLNVGFADPADRMIGLHLADMVDEAGYLRGDAESVAERLGCAVEKVEAVLALMQNFEPSGVMARDVGECLAIQQKARDRLDPAMKALLENLDILAKRNLAALRKICGVDAEDLAEMIEEVRALNPKPGLAFGSEIIQPVVPDVFVRAKPDGGWMVELNSDTLPRVLVNSRYYAKVNTKNRTREEKTFMSECLSTANWLVKSLDQRARTILKVSSEIVIQQEGFFRHGVEHLRPLNLRTVAEAIEMHESTVSRVTANKYMATPRGIYELKYFFTSSIPAADGGDSHSAEAVRHRIKVLIDAEDTKAILSDDKLVELLRNSEINIARRTVAKYREAMGIPSSVQRRRMKNLPLK